MVGKRLGIRYGSFVMLFSLLLCVFKNFCNRGGWVTQLAKQLTLGFSSGHDLRVMG